MSKPSTFFFPSSSTNKGTICTSADYAGAGSLNINSNEPDGSYTMPYGMRRTVSVSSPNDISGVTVTINGYGLDIDGTTFLPTSVFNKALTATVTGVNADTQYTTNKLFRKITSITINGAANDVEVGFGSVGYSGLYLVDYNRPYMALTATGQFLNRAASPGGADYGIIGSPIAAETPNPYGGLDVFPDPLPFRAIASISQTTITTTSITVPYAYLLGVVKDNVVANTNERAYFYFLQQGV